MYTYKFYFLTSLPKTGSEIGSVGQSVNAVGEEGERTINMPISTEGSGMPTTKPKTTLQSRVLGQVNEVQFHTVYTVDIQTKDVYLFSI